MFFTTSDNASRDFFYKMGFHSQESNAEEDKID